MHCEVCLTFVYVFLVLGPGHNDSSFLVICGLLLHKYLVVHTIHSGTVMLLMLPLLVYIWYRLVYVSDRCAALEMDDIMFAILLCPSGLFSYHVCRACW